ncbi:hypothetical protein Ciccas_006499 [Cichlidogyrus casuarinus]|uniref:Condensin complex subunit 1 C-terminal domain-containing protein n=1 Tax=Cichlidogyrus casuarinus TaxID=1844966 RepID=A0ABD2Q803_9PLAT
MDEKSPLLEFMLELLCTIRSCEKSSKHSAFMKDERTLSKLLQSDNSNVRRNTARLIGLNAVSVDAEFVYHSFLKILHQDPDKNVRFSVASEFFARTYQHFCYRCHCELDNRTELASH